MIRWASFFITSLLEISVIVAVTFMHNTTAIISFFTILLFSGVIVQESREDMPQHQKQIISGFMFGTYAAAAAISFMVYRKYILV